MNLSSSWNTDLTVAVDVDVQQVRLPVTQLTASQSDLTSGECTQFATLIPASEMTARVALTDDDGQSTASDGCVWELVHCRSETEGRPETVFQLAWYVFFSESSRSWN